MKIITPEPREALSFDEIPDNSVFMRPGAKPEYFLKFCNSDGAVNLQSSAVCFASGFVDKGKKFYLVDAELVIK